MINNSFPEVSRYLALRVKVAKLVDSSEREDLLAEIQIVKSTSIGVSILCALDDIQTRYPLLLAFLVTCLVLKMVF